MKMEYAEALEAIKKMEGGVEFVNAVMSEVQKKGSSEKAARDKFNSYKSSVEGVFSKYGIDPEKPEESLKSFKSSIEQGNLAKTEKGSLEESLNKTREIVAALEEKSKKSDEIIAKRTAKTLKTQLANDLNGKIYGHDANAEVLVLKNVVKMDENENLVFVKSDGTFADYKAGLTSFIDNHEDKITTQKGGAGSKPAANTQDSSFLSKAQYMAMSPSDKKANHETAMKSKSEW